MNPYEKHRIYCERCDKHSLHIRHAPVDSKEAKEQSRSFTFSWLFELVGSILTGTSGTGDFVDYDEYFKCLDCGSVNKV
jgi:hypothetical protein